MLKCQTISQLTKAEREKPMSYTNLLYHIVYATKGRAPLITKTLQPDLHKYLAGTVRGLGGVPIEINGVADHVHLLVKIKPVIAVSDFLTRPQGRFVGVGKKEDCRPLCMADQIRRVYRERVTG